MMAELSDLKGMLQKRGMSAPAAQKQNDLIVLLRDERVRQQLALALPKHVSVDRMLRIVMTEVRRNPQLARCDQQSFLAALMLSAQLGLEAGGPLGHAYLVPYSRQGRTECQLIIGYRGLIELARRSGQIDTIEARAVFDGDKFECAFGLQPKLNHEPAWDNPDRTNPDALRYVYAIARLKDGGIQYEVMSRREILAVRAQSRAQSGPWQTHFVEMSLKTVLRRLCKLLPMSVELADAVEADERAEMGIAQDLPVLDTAVATGQPEHGSDRPAPEQPQQPEQPHLAAGEDEIEEARR